LEVVLLKKNCFERARKKMKHVCANFILKVIIVGDSGIGKTCLLDRIRGNEFAGEGRTNATVGIDFYAHRYDNEQKGCVKLQIWDTAGHERFSAITSTYLRDADACVLVYDASKDKTQERLAHWHSHVLDAAPNAKFMVIGSKADVGKPDSIKKAMLFAKRMNFAHVALSAKGSEQHEITRAFESLGNEAVQTAEPMERTPGVEREGRCCQ
jgi:small GTP-binding protein